MGPYFAQFGGQSGGLGSRSGREEGSFLSVQVFCYSPGLNFDSSEMIYINVHHRIKEMITN